METPSCQTSLNADTSLSVTATLPPKKRSLERRKNVCTEPKEINTLTTNFKSTKLPKTPLLNANQTLLVTSQLPPKKRSLDRVKEFCTEPQDINSFQSNSISAEVPKIILDVPERSLIIHPRFQQKPFLDVEPQKTDPAPETALKNSEPAPLLFLEYNINDQEKKQGEPSEPPQRSIYSTSTQVPKTTLGAPEQSLIIHPHFQQKPFTGQQPEKIDPKSKTAVKNNESEPLLLLEYNNNDRKKEQGEPSEPSRCCIHCRFNSTYAEVPKTTLRGPEQSLTIHPRFHQKTFPDQELQKTDPKSEIALRNNGSTPSLFLEYIINDREKEQGEPSEPPRRSFPCKFCRQCFSSTQALGGHQNAHRREREQQKAMNEAKGFGFPTSLNGLPGLLQHPLHRSYMGHPYHPYQRAIQERPVFSHPGIGLGHGSQSSFAQAVERFMESSPTRRPLGTSTDPRWTPPHASSGGPIRLSNGSANFNRLAGSNLTGYRQGMGNEANLIQRHRVEPSGLNRSLMSRGFGNVQSSSNQNESTELDLDLKL